MMDEAILHQAKAGLIPCRLEDILQTLEHECGNGGRIEMLYARPQNGSVFELRYLVNHAESSGFNIIVCETTESAPSMAHHFPLLGWYEREVSDLYGIKFQDHPQPYSLIRQEHDAADSLLCSKAPISKDCLSDLFGRMSSNPPNSHSIIVASRSSITILDSFSNTVAWKDALNAWNRVSASFSRNVFPESAVLLPPLPSSRLARMLLDVSYLCGLNCCGLYWQNWNGFIIILPTSDFSPTPQR
jgi:Respiratory-chain NADH dehydrogenase, 30 Kd subunit